MVREESKGYRSGGQWSEKSQKGLDQEEKTMLSFYRPFFLLYVPL